MSHLPNRTSFKKGVSGNPEGKPKGTKDRFGHTCSAKRAVPDVLDRFGNDVVLLETALVRGLQAKAPSSFPYLKLIVEHNMRTPEQNVSVKDKIVLAPRD